MANINNMIAQAVDLYQQGDFSAAEQLITDKLATESEMSAQADLQCLLGAVYYQTGRMEQAEQVYQQAATIYRNLQQQTDLAAACNNLGVLYRALQREQDAEQAYGEAISIYRQLAEKQPENLPTLATYLNNLGNLYSAGQQLAQAIAVYQEAIGIIRQLAAQDEGYTPLLADALNNLGIHHYQIKQYAEAEAAYKEAIAIWQERSSSNEAFCPSLAVTCSNLAALYRASFRYPEAEALYRQALQLRQSIRQSHSEDLSTWAAEAEANIKLGNVLRDDGRDNEAEPYYLAAIDIRKDLEAQDEKYGPQLAMAYYNMAAMYYNDMNRKQDAKRYFHLTRNCAMKYYNSDRDCAAMVMRIRNLPDEWFE